MATRGRCGSGPDGLVLLFWFYWSDGLVLLVWSDFSPLQVMYRSRPRPENAPLSSMVDVDPVLLLSRGVLGSIFRWFWLR